MNIKIANAVLKQLNNRIASASPEDRTRILVARRWLQANIKLEYDYMVRLQTLEGAADVKIGTWWQKGRQGLLKAQAFFADKGIPVNPLWVSTSYTGMFGILEKLSASILSQHRKIQMEPSEIITNALMGMGTGDPAKDRMSTIWHAGHGRLKAGILSGEETPETAAKGVIGKGIVQLTLGQAKRVRLETGMPTDDEGNPFDIPDDNKTGREASDYLMHLLFKGNDPLAKKVQAMLREAFAPSKPMTIWLDAVMGTLDMDKVRSDWIAKKMGQKDVEGTPDEFEAQMQQLGREFDSLGLELKRGAFPSSVDVANAAGIFKQDFSTKHFKPSWERFFKLLWSDLKVRADMAIQMDNAGVDKADMYDPEVIMRELEEAASRPKKITANVASLFRLRQALSELPLRFLKR